MHFILLFHYWERNKHEGENERERVNAIPKEKKRKIDMVNPYVNHSPQGHNMLLSL